MNKGSDKNPYNPRDWIDHIIDTRYPVGDPRRIVQQGTRFWAEYMNYIENGIYEAYERLIEDERRIQRVEVKIALQERSSSNNVFYDPFDGQAPSKLTLDISSAVIKDPLVVGHTVLNVDNTDGFKAFTEVTIYDDVNNENKLITAIDVEAKTITIQALTNSYKKGAKIARSTVTVDTQAQEMNIGDWGTYSVSVVEVI